MNTDLLRSWLGLPPGPWPPDDRTLLGLPAAAAAAADAERKALEQMDKLRPHQLLHPDLVTEGMNRLAQAMIALTDPAARPAPPPAAHPDEDDFPPLDVTTTTAARPPAAATAADMILDAAKLAPLSAPRPVVPATEVVLDAEPVAAPPPPPLVAEPPPPNVAPPVVAVETAEVEPLGVGYRPADRRKGYAELVALRAVLRAWEKLQPYFGVPSEPLAGPAQVLGFVEAARGCRTALALSEYRDWFARYGGAVVAVVRNPLALSVFRDLVGSQRQALAADWAAAAAELKRRYKSMRRGLRESKPRKRYATIVRDSRHWLRENPEWVLAALITFAVIVGLLRTALRPASAAVS